MAEHGAVGVGIIGAGMISDAYLEHMTSFPDLKVLQIGDIATDRAAEQAEKWNVAGHGAPDVVLDDPDVEIVVNLTIPAAHAEIAMEAIGSGKHVWNEKPIAVDRESASELLRQADAAGLRVGVAPDTMLGPGMQTALRAVRSGAIGTPLVATTCLQYTGPDIMHPNPEFLFQQGAGPLFDMGPYYLTALAHILGPFARVAAVGSQAQKQRVVKVGERAGTKFDVEVPTSVAAIAQFEDGGTAQSMLSFDSPMTRNGVVEVAGTEGTIIIPDPNRFTGEIRVYRAPSEFPWPMPQPFEEIAPVGRDVGRGVGVLDMARSIRNDTPHIATGALGLHVLDTIIAISESIESGEFVEVSTSIDPVAPLPSDFDPFASTL